MQGLNKCWSCWIRGVKKKQNNVGRVRKCEHANGTYVD